jgi:hypothetical protein
VCGSLSEETIKINGKFFYFIMKVLGFLCCLWINLCFFSFVCFNDVVVDFLDVRIS